MKLSHSLAQEIVNKIIPILHMNINIMDETGVIIGTGDQDRLFTTHEGAKQVLADLKTIEVFPNSNLVGTKPGINLPIYFGSQTIGVVGITGDPEKVKPYAEMVKVHTEMLVEKNYLHEKILQESKAKDQLIYDIVTGQFKTKEQLQEAYSRCAILNLSLDGLAVPLLIEIIPQESTSSEKVSHQLEGYISKLHRYLGEITQLEDYRFYTQISSYRFLVILELGLGISGSSSLTNKTIVMKKTNQLFQKLPKQEDIILHIGIGSFVEKLADYPQAYNDAVFALTINKDERHFQIHYFDDVGIKEVVGNLDDFIKTSFTKDMEKVFLSEPKLVEALMTFIEEDGNITKAAARLGIQRATLIHRLDKVHDLTNKNPRNFTDLLELYLARYILLP